MHQAALEHEEPTAAGASTLSAFYEAWFEPVYAYFARRTPDAATAEDLTADAFERLFAALPTLRVQSTANDANDAVRAWVYRTAANVYKNALRGSSRRQARASAWSAGWPASADGRAEQEASLALSQAMARLQPSDQDLLGLRYWDGLTAAEIAAVRGCDVRAVYTAVERCLRALKPQLSATEMPMAGAPVGRPDAKGEGRVAQA